MGSLTPTFTDHPYVSVTLAVAPYHFSDEINDTAKENCPLKQMMIDEAKFRYSCTRPLMWVSPPFTFVLRGNVVDGVF